MNNTTLSVLLLCFCSVHGNSLGPYKGAGNKGRATQSPQNPSCASFDRQDLPAETVQLITYGAPEVSWILAMGLTGDQKTFPSPGQEVTAHHVLYLDDCTFIGSSRDDGEPFTFIIGEGQVIEGWERGIAQMSLGQRVAMTLSPDMGYGESGTEDGAIPPNATLVFDVEILNIQ